MSATDRQFEQRVMRKVSEYLKLLQEERYKNMSDILSGMVQNAFEKKETRIKGFCKAVGPDDTEFVITKQQFENGKLSS